MSGITLKEVVPSIVPTPASGKDTLFIDSSNANIPSYKDSAGLVHTIGGIGATGAAGPIGPAIVMMDDHNYEESNQPMVSAGATGALSYVPSVAISQASMPVSVNVSTEGTVDWYAINGTTSTPRLLSAGSVHGKAAGSGAIPINFEWIVNGSSIFSQTFAMTVTSNAGDDCATTVLAASTNGSGIFNNTVGATLYGFRFSIPSSWRRAYTLNIYCAAFSAIVTVTAALPNESLTTSLTFDTGASAGLERKITVNYQGEGPLIITALVTTNRGGSPNVKFQCATQF